MRIVDRKAFLAMPVGTVFAKYAPCYFEELQVKDRSLDQSNDYFYTDLVCPVDAKDSSEFSEKLQAAEELGALVPLHMHIVSRDGCFDSEQLFAVYERSDVEALIARLQETLG